MPLEIRPLRVDDAATVAGIHVRSWQAAYAGLFPDEYLAALSVEERAANWSTILTDPPIGPRLMAELDGDAVGFVAGAWASPTTPDAAEVLSIYLDPPAWRRGVGGQLLAAGVAELRATDPLPVVLWVLDGNESSRRFYEAQGWRADGATRTDTVGGAAAPHVRYRLD